MSKSMTEEPLAEQIFRALLDRIYLGDLQPGSPVNEAALAAEFEVSRGPVREAVRRLQGIQLITREPYLKARVTSLDAATARELFEMRMALEGVACNLAATRMSDEDVQTVMSELDGDRQARRMADDGSAPRRVFDFHERIVRSCGNQRIIGMLCGDLYHLLRLYRRRSGGRPERKEDAYREHWQILRAIQLRDGPLAESLMRTHIERAAEHLFAHLQPTRKPS